MDPAILIAICLLISLCEGVAQASANMLRHTGNLIYLIGGGLFYTIIVYLLSKAHKSYPMGVVNSIWSGLSVIVIILVGYFCFGQIVSKDQLMAMGVIAGGVIYLSLRVENEP